MIAWPASAAGLHRAARENIERVVAISDANRWPFGETLE
jgi:hypothetical protein